MRSDAAPLCTIGATEPAQEVLLFTRTKDVLRDEWSGGHAYLISARPPTTRQRWLARAVEASLLAAFAIALPLTSVQLPTMDAFVPIANTIVCLNDLITASLLYTQFAVTRKRGLIALAGGYLFAALLLVPYQLSFPGAFSPNGLLGGNLQITPWLFMLQQYAILIGALLYAIDAGRRDLIPHNRSLTASIAGNVGSVAAAALVLTWLVAAHADLLPTIMRDAINKKSMWDPVVSPLEIVSTLPVIIVFRRRRASILDLWLRVALVSWVLEVLLLAIVPARFSLVWYIIRMMSVVSSSLVLLALLTESMMLHSRLELSLVAREHEREGKHTAIDVIIGSIAHELRQPLAAIKSNGDAGARLLAFDGAERRQVREIFDDIRASASRANEILESIRALAAPSARDEQSIDMNDLIRQAVKMTRMDIEARGVEIHVDLAPNLPSIRGHQGQLIQVLVNGVTNALESLAPVSDRPPELAIRSAPRDLGGVSVLIEDSGVGIDPAAGDFVFEPFYSTKSAGMGLGLSICQAIVEAHGGTLSLTARAGHGAIFRVDLPDHPPAAEPGPTRPQVDLRSATPIA